MVTESNGAGCEFCCYKEVPDEKLYPRENVGYDFYAGVWKMCNGGFEEYEVDTINFCPVCGRRIGGMKSDG